MCWEKGPLLAPFRGLDTDGVKVELARGKDGGFGVDRGKVLEDLPPEGFLLTTGGPDESGRAGFTYSDGLADP